MQRAGCSHATTCRTSDDVAHLHSIARRSLIMRLKVFTGVSAILVFITVAANAPRAIDRAGQRARPRSDQRGALGRRH
jgi:hypothetical protein